MSFHELALKLLEIDHLPLPRMDGFQGDVYLTDADYQRLYNIIRQYIDGVNIEWWENATEGQRTACMETAIEAMEKDAEQIVELAAEQPVTTPDTDPTEDSPKWKEYRFEREESGELLTVNNCDKLFKVKGYMLNRDEEAKANREKNPDGRGDVYRYVDVKRIADVRHAPDEDGY